MTGSDQARFSGYVPKQGNGMAKGCTSIDLLGGWEDEYEGVVIDPTSLNSTANAFASQLRASLAYWRSKVCAYKLQLNHKVPLFFLSGGVYFG